MAEDTIHVVMLPWSAFGHLMPFFKLSIALAKAGVHVSYISTPKNTSKNSDQPLNARLLVDKGLAIEVKRNDDGTFTRYEIAKSLRQAMVLEEGKELRIKTREEAAGIVGNLKLHQDHYIAAFVQFLKDGIRKAI